MPSLSSMPGVVTSSIQVAGLSPSSILGTPSTLCTQKPHLIYYLTPVQGCPAYYSMVMSCQVQHGTTSKLPHDAHFGLMLCKNQTVSRTTQRSCASSHCWAQPVLLYGHTERTLKNMCVLTGCNSTFYTSSAFTQILVHGCLLFCVAHESCLVN